MVPCCGLEPEQMAARGSPNPPGPLMRKGTSPRGYNGHLPEEGIAVRPARHVLRVLAAIITGAVGWTAIDARRPPSASTWIINAASAAVVVAILALITAAILGGRDSRSPFERTMLFLCLVLQRPPATYLPPQPPEHPKAARACHQERPRLKPFTHIHPQPAHPAIPEAASEQAIRHGIQPAASHIT